MAKVEGSLRAYCGQCDDLEEFWPKFQVVGKIQKWSTGKDRMAHLPLYLSGDAFTVWSQMDDAGKEDEDKVKERLSESFVFSAGEAYAQFVHRKKRRMSPNNDVSQPQTVFESVMSFNCWISHLMAKLRPLMTASNSDRLMCRRSFLSRSQHQNKNSSTTTAPSDTAPK